ncbi:hypothetical protein GCM10009769_13380 [Curtobacterium luteum]|uniref:Uncharacterized protein n=1 Tax=Curtobacterium luteum TaxID=33881 RepID=A0A8H9L090_9MICO|nr:hypothetical protein GCM10009769_13380 [Curtobacterium luteum]
MGTVESSTVVRAKGTGVRSETIVTTISGVGVGEAVTVWLGVGTALSVETPDGVGAAECRSGRAAAVTDGTDADVLDTTTPTNAPAEPTPPTQIAAATTTTTVAFALVVIVPQRITTPSPLTNAQGCALRIRPAYPPNGDRRVVRTTS